MLRPTMIRRVGEGSDKYIRMLVDGEPGSGKTCLAGTSPKCLIADADRGTEVLDIRGLRKPEIAQISDWTQMLEIIEYLRNSPGEYDWFWIDSLSGFQDLGLDDIMRSLVREKAHRKVYLPDKGEYGQNMNRLGLLLRELRELPINWGVTTHLVREEDFDDGKIKYMPWIQGRSMPERVCSYVGVVGRTEKFNKDNVEQVRFTTRSENGKFYTKDRFGIGSILDPSIPKIMRKIEMARTAAKAQTPPTGAKKTA